MLKRLTPLAAVALLLALAAIVPAPPVRADRLYSVCDPFKSSLCNNLVALYEFEEDSDYARTSELGGSPFLEPDGVNLSRTATKKTGSYAFNHTAVANSYLYIPRTVGFSGTFTLSFWLYVDTLPSADTKVVPILSMKTDAGGVDFPIVELYRSGASTYVWYAVKQGVSDSTSYVQSSSAVSASTWYLVTLGQYPTPTTSEPYQMTLWMEINGGTRATATVAYPSTPALGSLMLGSWYATSPTEYGAYKVDQLGVWSKVFGPAEVDKLYASGSGKAFPFVD